MCVKQGRIQGPRTFHLLHEVQRHAQPQHVAVHTRVVNRTVTVLVLRLIETQDLADRRFARRKFLSVHSFLRRHFAAGISLRLISGSPLSTAQKGISGGSKAHQVALARPVEHIAVA